MAIPGFQSFFSPLLDLLRDEKEHYWKDVKSLLAVRLALSDKDKQIMLPSNTEPTWSNRAAWAKTHLKQAQMIVYPKRGMLLITNRGKQALTAQSPINMSYLMQFDEYKSFRSNSNQAVILDTPELILEQTIDPQERLETAYSEMKSTIAAELLDKIQNSTPEFFERLVVELMLKMGYGGSRQGAGKAIGKVNDEGVDGVIDEDRLGLDRIYLQAKRWNDSRTVGRPDLQQFIGSLVGHQAKKGVFITTSRFAESAKDYVKNIEQRVSLIDGRMLAELMLDINLGVTTEKVFEIKRVDNDFFEEA